MPATHAIGGSISSSSLHGNGEIWINNGNPIDGSLTLNGDSAAIIRIDPVGTGAGSLILSGTITVDGQEIPIGDGGGEITVAAPSYRVIAVSQQFYQMTQMLEADLVSDGPLENIAVELQHLSTSDYMRSVGSLLQNSLASQTAMATKVAANNASIIHHRSNAPTAGFTLNTASSSDQLAIHEANDPSQYASFLQNEEAAINDRSLDAFTGSAIFDWLPDNEIGVYLLTSYTQSDIDATANQLGSESKQFDIHFGSDFEIVENLRVGGAIGYANIDSDADQNLGNTTVDAISLLSYANYFLTPNLRIDTSAGITYSNYDIERNIFVGASKTTATAATDARQYSFEIGANYLIDDLPVENLTLTPFAYLQYTKTEIDGYTESGAGTASQKVKDQEDISLVSSLGALVSYKIERGASVFEPFISASYQHEFKNDSRNVSFSFVGNPANPFTAIIDSTDENYYAFSTGFLYASPEDFSIRLNYDTNFENDNIESHRISAAIRFNF
ncbi:autotransporter outer membrane beta-barrel domain-containing protein [Poriferisphaera corsica]|nr:autotransporter outer membrane beta-barrel domain-containing protein [Poriferisphaera corsica]